MSLESPPTSPFPLIWSFVTRNSLYLYASTFHWFFIIFWAPTFSILKLPCGKWASYMTLLHMWNLDCMGRTKFLPNLLHDETYISGLIYSFLPSIQIPQNYSNIWVQTSGALLGPLSCLCCSIIWNAKSKNHVPRCLWRDMVIRSKCKLMNKVKGSHFNVLPKSLHWINNS